METDKEHISVVIIGGGPIGLFLAICLNQKGIVCRVLEKRSETIKHSRSLGIHPVSLELFSATDIIDSFLDRGLKIKKGIAIGDEKKLGEITFEHTPKPFNYILSCPQYVSEQILEEELYKLNPDVLKRNTEFVIHKESKQHVTVSYMDNKQLKKISCDFIIGCDGKNSKVRDIAGITFDGSRYPDTYIMGDFSDTTEFGTDAVVYLPKQGLVECFPLPNGMRRWVVKTDEFKADPSREELEGLVRERVGYDLSNTENVMLSGFGVQHYLASSFAKGRVLLAGDAAHVVSPIGGQGMNLGWLDGWALAQALSTIYSNPEFITGSSEDWRNLLKAYSKSQKSIAKKAIRRAEMNMALGRKYNSTSMRDTLVKALLKPPFNRTAAKMFTMRKLDKGFI